MYCTTVSIIHQNVIYVNYQNYAKMIHITVHVCKFYHFEHLTDLYLGMFS